MKKFLCKSLLVIIPLLLLSINYAFYEPSGGDLAAIGKISIGKDYRTIFSDDFQKEIKYLDLKNIDLSEEFSAHILNIGDSFSVQGGFGYQNFLCYYGLTVVNLSIGTINADSPVQLLFSIVNGDILDKLKVDYVILETVERSFARSAQRADIDKKLFVYDINVNSLKKENPDRTRDAAIKLGIFRDMAVYSLWNFLYRFDERAFTSKVYKVNLTKKLFSTDKNQLLFYYDDVDDIPHSNRESVMELNNKLNLLSKRLKEREIRLIVLPAPDKYDLYSDFIENNPFPKNKFFDYLRQLEKEYIFIDSKALLLEHINTGMQDVYFADDTHWSPIASKIIAKKIYEELHYEGQVKERPSRQSALP